MRRKKYHQLWAGVLAVFIAGVIFAQPKSLPSFHLVEVQLSENEDLTTLRQLGFDFESAHRYTANSLRLIIREDRLPLLTKNNLRFSILERDLGKLYAQRAKEARRIEPPDGFGYGSMAGFYTFDEMLAKLDTLHILYPEIVSERESIGTSVEGRNLWAVKISDNFQEDEVEPEVLYTALHHAREPVSMMSVLYYMHWLATNYGTNSDATYLVDEREMWFVPCLNPDGYVYNQELYDDSDGTTVGMWRKNKRDNNGDDVFNWYDDGVDLNRNYGSHWGFDNNGSSGSPGSATYRGEAPFSEPETNAIRDFVLSHSFSAALNYHTFGDLMIYPFSYQPETYPPEPDYSIFRELSQRMTDYNGYEQGTGPDILYVTNGDSDDWMYDGMTNQSIYSMTPEVGGDNDGFWPSPSRLFPLVKEALYHNKYLAFAVGAFPRAQPILTDNAREDPDTIDVIIPVRNQGLEPTSPSFQAEISNLSNTVSFEDSTFLIGQLQGRTSDTLTFTTIVSPYAMNGQRCRLKIELSDGSYSNIDTMDFRIGAPLFADNAEGGMANWNTDQWGISNQGHNESHSFTDSPESNYPNYSEVTMTLNRSLDFSDIIDPELQFRMYCATEADYDFAQVLASTDSAEWVSLAGEYTRLGSGSGVQSPEEHGYDGHRGWVFERMDLSEYAGEEQVYLRFVMESDAAANEDGMYIDDIAIYGTERPSGPLVFLEPSTVEIELPFGLWGESQIALMNQGSDTLHYSIREEADSVEQGPASSLPRNDGMIGLHRLLSRHSAQAELQSLLNSEQDGLERDPGTVVNEIVIQDSIGDGFDGAEGIIVPDIQSVAIETDTILIGQRTMFDIRFQSSVQDTLIGLISLDVDQNHATGSYPAALGLLPHSVSIGAEYEIIALPQGLNFFGTSEIDTAISVPAGSALIVDMADTTIAAIGTSAMPEPDLLQVTILPGLTGLAMDGSRFNLAVAALAGSVADTSLAGIPDFAPNIGHGTYGRENGASWLAVSPVSGTISPNSQETIRIPMVASAFQDELLASLMVLSNSVQQDSLIVPVDLSVLSAPEPQISVDRTAVSDTLVYGYPTNPAIQMNNTGSGSLAFFVADTGQQDWFDVTPRVGTIESGASQQITFHYSPDPTADSTQFHGNVFIASTSVTGSLLNIPVELVIGYNAVALRGDLNRDSDIQNDDIALLNSLILSSDTATSYQYWAGDMNEDGVLDIRDVLILVDSISSQ